MHLHRATLAAVLIGSVLSPAALAASVAGERQDFPVERLRISPNRSGLIDVLWGDTPRHLSWDVGVWAGYAANPLIVLDEDTGERAGALVEDRVGGAFVGSLGLFDFAEISFELPAVFAQGRGATQAFIDSGASLSNLDGIGIADLRVMPKVRIVKQDTAGVDVAVVAGFTLPTGGARAYFGDAGATFAPELVVSRRVASFRFAANLGASLRGETIQMVDQTIGSELTARVGAGWRSGEAGDGPWELASSLSGATSLSEPLEQANQNALEWRGQVAFGVWRAIQLFAGAGVGLSPGWGTPDWRAYGGVRIGPWTESAPEPEPAPQPEPEAVPAPPPPPEVDLDADGDGVPDDLDGCPNEPEDRDGFADEDGCPDPDNDGDGVLDVDEARAECVDVPGPADNGGCPDSDRDGDTVVDRLDNCPDVAGVADNHGCPAKTPQLVVLKKGQLEILESVHFATNKDVILPRSFPLLDNVAQVLKDHPEIERVLIEGHTDSQGRLAHNLDLSDRRAKAVRQHLVAKGIDAKRLEARGFGPNRPIADNATKAGRAKNRRVEFKVLSPDEPDLEPTNRGPDAGTVNQ